MSEKERQDIKEVIKKYKKLPQEMKQRFNDMLIGCTVALEHASKQEEPGER